MIKLVKLKKYIHPRLSISLIKYTPYTYHNTVLTNWTAFDELALYKNLPHHHVVPTMRNILVS